MKGIVLACVLVFIVAGQRRGVTAGKPTMLPQGGEILIQEGHELRIECQGEGRIQFATQTLVFNVERSNFSITEDEDSGRYTFIRPRTTSADTGWYACAEEGIEIRNDEQMIDHPSDDISWIYVYVNSSIPFAVMGAMYDIIPVMAGSNAVIPCRPTSPGLEVVLHSETSQGELLPLPQFDPRIGFVIYEVDKRQNFENFLCLLRGSGEWDGDDWPRYTLHVADPKPLENPVINEDELSYVVWGKDVTLDCRITVPALTRMHLRWQTPDSVSEDRLVQHRPEQVDKLPAKEIWHKELTITQVQPSDAGEYICVAMGVFGNTARSSTKLQIWDPSYTYINVTVEGGKHITYKEKETAQWLITIDTYPEEFKWTWFKEDGTLIDTTGTDGRNKYSHRQDGPNHVFKISHLLIEDTGTYTLRISTPNNETSIDLPLTVFGQPLVTLYNTLPYYAPGQSAIFECTAIGLPLPNITWNYIEYPDFPSKENHRLISISNMHTKKMNDPFKSSSRANITINMTGDVVCRSCNEINCSKSTRQIFVSDVAGFFGIRYPEIVTEGDDVNVTCGASVYHFTNNINWRSSDPTKPREFFLDRIQINNRRTKFTSQSILHIPDVRKSDSGDYICEAVSKEGHSETEVYHLSVEDARLPTFNYANLNNSKIAIDLKVEKYKDMTLECHADGRPIPKVTWRKNDELLTENTQYKFSENNSRLQLGYFLNGDSGRYSCEASNRIGKVERYIDIQISGASYTYLNLSIVLTTIALTIFT